MLTDEKIHRIFAPVLMHDLPLSKLPKTYPWTEVLANSIKLSPTAAKLMGHFYRICRKRPTHLRMGSG